MRVAFDRGVGYERIEPANSEVKGACSCSCLLYRYPSDANTMAKLVPHSDGNTLPDVMVLFVYCVLGRCRRERVKREFGKYNGNVNKDVLINNSIFTRRQWRPFLLEDKWRSRSNCNVIYIIFTAHS